MSDLDLSVWVSTDDVDLSAYAFPTEVHSDDKLFLNVGPFRIRKNGIQPGTRRWRRNAVESRWMHGRVVTNSVLEQSESMLGMFIAGENQTQLRNHISAITETFTQFKYEFHFTIDGTPYAWSCERADIEFGFTTEHVIGLYVPAQITLFRSPISVDGPF